MKTLIVNRAIIPSIIFFISICFITETTYSEVTISEIMYGSKPVSTPPQWIEISNAGTESVDMTDWKLVIQNADSENLDGPLNATIVFQDDSLGDAPMVLQNETLLVVTEEESSNTSDVMDDQVFNLRRRGGLDISLWDTILSGNGFLIQLIDNAGQVVDQAGNYDGNTILWNLPYAYNRGRIRAGNRTSLLRQYDNGVALDGTKKESWVAAADANLPSHQLTYYGDEDDISSPRILGSDTRIHILDISYEPPDLQIQEPSKPITISEIMYGSDPSFMPTQWIEIFNTGSEPINLTGWNLTIQNADATNLDGPLNATVVFVDEARGEAPRIYPNDFLLIVVDEGDNNDAWKFSEDRVFALRWRGGLDIDIGDTFMSGSGFLIQLIDKDGNVVDEAGNYDGSKTTWDLPYGFNRGRTKAGNRTSLIRLYDDGEALDGTLESSWVSAADANLTEYQRDYYGDVNDISSAGIGIIDFSASKPSEPTDNLNGEESVDPPLETENPLEGTGGEGTFDSTPETEKPAEDTGGEETVDTTPETEKLAEDVNGDGTVNILDLVYVASKFGQTGEDVADADVNGDGFVNILDLVRIAGAFGENASSSTPSSQ